MSWTKFCGTKSWRESARNAHSTPRQRSPGRNRRTWVWAALATLLCAPVLATPGWVQDNSSDPQTDVTTLTVPFTETQTAGNLNYVAIGWIGSPRTILSVTDTQGNTYIPATTVISGPSSYEQVIFYAQNIAASASNSITVRFDSPVSNLDVRIAEYAGLRTTNVLDVTASASGTGTSADAGAVTTSNANDLLVATNKVEDSTSGPGTGFSQELISYDGDILEYKVVSAAGSYDATAPQGSSAVWIMQMVAFRAAGSPPNGDTTPPSAPTGLSSTISPGTPVNLSWTASTDNVGVTAYIVDRCQGANCSNFSPLAIPSGTSYSDMGLAGSSSYTYRVRATDAAGNISAGATISVTTPAVTFVQGSYSDPQSPVSSVSATYTRAQSSGDLNVVSIAWSDATSHVTSITDTVGNTYVLAVGPTNNGFNTQALYYAKNITSAAASANSVTVTFDASVSYPDVRLAEYSGLDTTSPLDKVSSGTGNGPTASAGPVTTIAANEVIVASAYFNSAGAGGTGTGYVLRVFSDPDGDVIEDQIVSSTGSYSASAPQGTSDYWVMSLATFKVASGGGGGGAPSAPTNLSASAGASVVNLTWTASTGSVSSYLIERCQGSGCTNFTQVGTAGTNAYTDSGLAASTTYLYRVRATDAGGDLSGYSNIATATTTGSLIAPVALTAPAVSSIEVDLSWGGSSGGAGTISYLIESCSGSGCSSFTQIGTSSSTSYYVLTNVSANNPYSFRVRAKDSAGDLSGYSNIFTLTTPLNIADCN